MPVISDLLTDGAKLGVGAEIVFTVRDIRDSVAHDAILGPARTTVPVNATTGLFTTPTLDPGPYWVGIRWSRSNPTHELYPIEVPAESGTFRLWPLIDAGAPPPPAESDGFIRNGGGFARGERTTIAEYAAMTAPDPETLYVVFES
ncbi:hypothetical protein G9444_2536 [Rhodococcus erythropolis]|uniref:Carboxypeptidase regulatory-like domain-containing protein n=1 Tax=Rhodococcus erythropolis TaxID=1833 RepID=A0A6G9CSJ2_RHOER|nr:hypothetical protein [Rhodococcus erythropolis]QIP39780.1 hypothetical protein G9444_2536 [Rhodococcus erythropolis]